MAPHKAVADRTFPKMVQTDIIAEVRESLRRAAAEIENILPGMLAPGFRECGVGILVGTLVGILIDE